MLLTLEQSFRRLDAPELLLEVAEGAAYADGVRVKQESERGKKKAPPELVYTPLDKTSTWP